jgi:hypothetical protein
VYAETKGWASITPNINALSGRALLIVTDLLAAISAHWSQRVLRLFDS